MRLFNRVERISLWNDLSSQGLVSGDVPSDENIESPWYVRLLIGLSGWIAALFMLGAKAGVMSVNRGYGKRKAMKDWGGSTWTIRCRVSSLTSNCRRNRNLPLADSKLRLGRGR